MYSSCGTGKRERRRKERVGKKLGEGWGLIYIGWRIQENPEVGVKIRKEERSKERGRGNHNSYFPVVKKLL